MKLNELLTDLDEKKEAVKEAVSELDCMEEDLNLFQTIDESDYMDDIIENPEYLQDDMYLAAFLDNLQERLKINFSEEKKESFKILLSEYIETRMNVMETIFDRCMDVSHALNECECISENIWDVLISSDFDSVIFKSYDNDNIRYEVPFDCIKEEDYIFSSVKEILSDIALSTASVEMDIINEALPKDVLLVFCVAEPEGLSNFEKEAYISVEMFSPFTENSKEIMCKNFSISEYIQTSTGKHFENLYDAVKNDTFIFEIEKDLITGGLERLSFSEPEMEIDMDYMEKDVMALEIPVVNDVDVSED